MKPTVARWARDVSGAKWGRVHAFAPGASTFTLCGRHILVTNQMSAGLAGLGAFCRSCQDIAEKRRKIKPEDR